MSLPKDWKQKPLSQLTSLLTDGTHYSPQSKSGPFKYLTSKNVRFGYLDITNIDMISEAEHKAIYAGCPVHFGDVMLTKDGAGAGNVALNTLEEPFSLLSSVAVVRGIENILSNTFLLQYLMSPQGQFALQGEISGQAITRVTLTTIKQLQIPLPPLPEQIEIARILGVWDAAIGDTTQLIAAKTQLKRGLMQQLLTGERRFAEFERRPFVSQAIGKVLELQSRFVEWDDEATYRLASVRRNSGGLFWREELRGEEIKVKKLHTLRTGDFLISHIQAAYGAMGLVNAEFSGGHVSDMYSILRPREGADVDIRFVNYLSQMPLMHRHVLQSSNGFFAERLRLNFDPLEFLKQKLDLPPTLEEQRRIADVLDMATREISLLQQKLDALKRQKRGLMQRLLSGEVRVAAADGGNLDGATPTEEKQGL